MKYRVYEHLLSFLIWVGVYFSPTYPMILSLGFIVLADLVTGVQASLKRGESYQSKKLRRTISKFIVYGVAVLVAHVIEMQFIKDFPSMKLISGFIAYVELKSINENIEAVTKVNFFKIILDRLNPNKK